MADHGNLSSSGADNFFGGKGYKKLLSNLQFLCSFVLASVRRSAIVASLELVVEMSTQQNTSGEDATSQLKLLEERSDREIFVFRNRNFVMLLRRLLVLYELFQDKVTILMIF